MPESPALFSQTVDVLVLTAVKDEQDVVLSLESDWKEQVDPSGFAFFTRVDPAGLRWATARAVDMGPEHAANLATRLAPLPKPRCLAMVGVCAGWREKVQLGDVIVAERLFRYDAGKLRAFREGKERKETVFHDIRTYNLDPRWRQRAEDFPHDWIKRIAKHSRPLGYRVQEQWLLEALSDAESGSGAHPRERGDERRNQCPDWTDVVSRLEKRSLLRIDGGIRLTDAGRGFVAEMRDRYPDGFPRERGAPKAFVAPMATGNRVIEDYDLFPTIHEYVRKTLGVDMEGSAVAAVAEIESVENYIVVKGVQDHADPDKDDRYRGYAVETSYRFLVDFIGSQLSPPKRSVHFVVPQVETPSFTGREDELENLEAVLLGDRRDHVCTIAGLSGAGGIGKSALAVHFATLYRHRFPDGVIGIRVDGKDNDTIAREFARTFGEPIDADDERDAPSIMQSIFSGREVLLIFDNAEDASIRHLVPGRLSSLIITTRNRGLPALLEVPPNARVDVPPLGESNGLELLRKRLGSRVEAELDGAKRIVGLVGGLPLALQIVASVLEVSWRSLSEMTDLLANERQRLSALAIRGEPDFDVRVSFNASLKFLKEEEIDFFACLSVCDADSFAVHSAAAAAECLETIARERLDYLYRLSLVNRQEETRKTRFVLHPLLRSFAGELAEERGIAKLARGRHARYFVKLLKTFDVKDLAPSNAIVEDVGEAVSAARWLLQENDADYNYVVRLEPLLVRSGFWQEAAALMAQFMSMAEAQGDSDAAVQLRIQHAKFEQLRGDFKRSIAILQPAINSGSTGNDRADAMLLNTYGGVLQRLGKFQEAAAALERGHDLLAEQGDARGQAMVLNSLGGVLQRLGKFQEAADALAKASAIEEQLGNQRGQAMVLNSLGGVLQRLGKFQEAADALERAKAISEQMGDERGLAMVLNSLGGVLQRLGKQEKADQSFATSITVGVRLGDKVHLAKVHTAYGKALISRGDLEAGVEQLRQGFLLDEQNRNKRGLAIVTPLLIRNLRGQGKPEEATEFLDRALTVAPNERALLRLSTASTEPSVSTEGVWLTGRVKRLLTPMGRPRFGFVTTDSEGMDVYFSENQIGVTVFSSLLEGARVEAHVVVMADGRRQARMIRAT